MERGGTLRSRNETTKAIRWGYAWLPCWRAVQRCQPFLWCAQLVYRDFDVEHTYLRNSTRSDVLTRLTRRTALRTTWNYFSRRGLRGDSALWWWLRAGCGKEAEALTRIAVATMKALDADNTGMLPVADIASVLRDPQVRPRGPRCSLNA